MEVRRWRRQVQEKDESSAEKKACFFRGRGHPRGGRDRLNRNRKEKNRTQMAGMKLIKKSQMGFFKIILRM